VDISAVIIVKNGAKTIKKCLIALKEFSEVIVYDNGSSDGTQDIVKKFANVRLIEGEFLGFGPTKNKASSYAKNPWILILDCDEVLDPTLVETLKTKKLDNSFVYKLNFNTYYRDKQIKYCGWSNQKIKRLYNKSKTKINDNFVHENIISKGFKLEVLKGNVKHYSYHEISNFLQKIDVYSSLFAKENAGKRKSSPLKAISSSLFAFFRTFILRKGFLDGFEGLIISFSSSTVVFFKYMKLCELNKDIKNGKNKH